jgi:hypothetical protein
MDAHQLVADDAHQTTSPADRRAWIRFGSDLAAVCHTPATRREVGWTARVKDISRGGVGLMLRHRFRRGTRLLVELRDHAGMTRVLAARVVRACAVVESADHGWLMGCTFETQLTEEELRDLT